MDKILIILLCFMGGLSYGDNQCYYYMNAEHNPHEIGLSGRGSVSGQCNGWIHAVEISEVEYRKASNAFNNHAKPYVNKWGDTVIQIRDINTKWDEATQSWIPDEEAIAGEKRRKFQESAGTVYNKYCNGGKWLPWKYHKLISSQQSELGNYCDALEDISSGKDTTSTELPKKPDWLN